MGLFQLDPGGGYSIEYIKLFILKKWILPYVNYVVMNLIFFFEPDF